MSLEETYVRAIVEPRLAPGETIQSIGRAYTKDDLTLLGRTVRTPTGLFVVATQTRMILLATPTAGLGLQVRAKLGNLGVSWFAHDQVRRALPGQAGGVGQLLLVFTGTSRGLIEWEAATAVDLPSQAEFTTTFPVQYAKATFERYPDGTPLPEGVFRPNVEDWPTPEAVRALEAAKPATSGPRRSPRVIGAALLGVVLAVVAFAFFDHRYRDSAARDDAMSALAVPESARLRFGQPMDPAEARMQTQQLTREVEYRSSEVAKETIYFALASLASVASFVLAHRLRKAQSEA